jgi:hypothetical protein
MWNWDIPKLQFHCRGLDPSPRKDWNQLSQSVQELLKGRMTENGLDTRSFPHWYHSFSFWGDSCILFRKQLFNPIHSMHLGQAS